MLDKFRTKKIIWNRADTGQFPDIRVSSSDENGRKLQVQVMDGEELQNMAGSILRLAWETKDGHYCGDDKFNLVDTANGLFEIYYTTGMLSNVGELTARLQLVDSKGTVGSEPFKITVFEGMNKESVQSSNSFTTLEDALQKVANIDGLLGSSNSQEERIQSQITALEEELSRVEHSHKQLLDKEKQLSASNQQKITNLENEMTDVKKKLADLNKKRGTQPQHLRLATFNIFVGMIDYAQYRRFMMEHRIDIAGVQEARKSHIPSMGIYNFSHISYADNGVGREEGYGNLIQSNLSHGKVIHHDMPVRSTAAKKKLIQTTIRAHSKDISVYNFHADSYEDNGIRFQQYAEIKRIMEADPTPYKILFGDFNVQDVEHYKQLGDLKSAQGFKGVWHETWNLSQGPWGTGYIDNILVTPNIEIMRVKMHWELMGSDHNPLWMDIHLD